MKLFLFGGAEVDLNQAVPEIKMIGELINQLGPEQVLHIPFARTVATEADWTGDWFNRNITLNATEYLNAANPGDIAKADHPLIFISGGREHVNLYEKIIADPRLLELIRTAEYIIGESAGSTVLGEYRRIGNLDQPGGLLKGLDIIKDTVIVPHYSERNRQEALIRDMEEGGARYGIGIDCLTAIVLEPDKFPGEYGKIGTGLVDVKIT